MAALGLSWSSDDLPCNLGELSREAAALCLEAASEGLAAAQHEVGVCYSEGRGVEKDEREAVRWFRRAANQGHPWGQFSLGCAYAEVSQELSRSSQYLDTWAAQLRSRQRFGCTITHGPGPGEHLRPPLALALSVTQQAPHGIHTAHHQPPTLGSWCRKGPW
mmetsp:Transcript_97591/g.279082  ORF Transcript_97591/g.279082 Transcript_97591/m.279082 type:complete len:162 (-) Transcript_97591:443-928(-)